MGKTMKVTGMLFTLAVAALTAFAPTCNAADKDMAYARYSFSSYMDGEFYTNTYTFGSDGFTSDGGDISTPAIKYCPRGTALICATTDSDMFVFAMPNHPLHAGERWRFNGRSFSLITYVDHSGPIMRIPGPHPELWSIKLMNRDMDVYVVGSGNLDGKHISRLYLFSPKYGLVAFLDVDVPPDNATYWLEDQYGILSAPFNAKISDEAHLTAREYQEMMSR